MTFAPVSLAISLSAHPEPGQKTMTGAPAVKASRVASRR
jgi:hypothetical protein